MWRRYVHFSLEPARDDEGVLTMELYRKPLGGTWTEMVVCALRSVVAPRRQGIDWEVQMSEKEALEALWPTL